MNVNTQSKDAENKFADIYALFDSYDIISLNTNRSVVTGKNGRRERHHSLNQMIRLRKHFYPEECFVPYPKNPEVVFSAEPFTLDYIVIGHPLETDSNMSGRRMAPELIKLTGEVKLGNGQFEQVELGSIKFDVDGPLFQKFDVTPLTKGQVFT